MSDETLRPPTAVAQVVPAYDPALVGIRGWLVLPAIGIVLSLLAALLGLIEVLALADEGLIVLGVGLLVQVPIVLFFGYVAKMFFDKRRNAPRLCIILQWGSVGLLWLFMASGLDPDPQLPGQVFGGAVSAAVWTLYFLRSRRVRQTFVN